MSYNARNKFKSRPGVKSRQKLRLLCSRSIAKRGVARTVKHLVIIDRVLRPRKSIQAKRCCLAFLNRERNRYIKEANRKACDYGCFC